MGRQLVQRRQAYYSKYYHIVRRMSEEDVLTECDRVMRPFTKEGSLIWANSDEIHTLEIDPVCWERVNESKQVHPDNARG